MNRFTSRQRKLLYAVGIVVLLGPIVYLGFPSQQSATAASSSGLGRLSQLRHDYSLGEATLGEVDPSSSAMNLVLLGLRGPAASVLHLKAIEYQERKQWAKLRTTVDSIILLQPHYVQIWKFQGWNLAYNVSREWDKVDDRFYWVKEGIKFLQHGTERNNTIPILEHNVGEVIDKKMGVSDEKKFFREFFVHDPDEKYKDKVTGINGPDIEINNEGIDSYLVARKHFQSANVKDDNDGIVEVKGMTHVFFRQGPVKALLNYADALTKEGKFSGAAPASAPVAAASDETPSEMNSAGSLTASVWKQAYDEWMNDYGKYPFLGRNNHKYILNSTEAELAAMAKENGINVEEQRSDWNFSVNMVNYRHWRDYAEMESDPVTISAHKSFVEARTAYAEGRGYNSVAPDGTTQISEAQKLLEASMDRWVEAAAKYPRLFNDFESYLEEALLSVRYWKAVHQNNGTTEAADYPLKSLWEMHPEMHLEIDRQFLIESRSRKK
ncbi:MAG: hypothetical protein KDB01_21180 [Planctomycetaceae bacterium]|nr:hypothetical protein [Planctomycetaceae bacterium]